jgi:hypothetical protein
LCRALSQRAHFFTAASGFGAMIVLEGLPRGGLQHELYV